jgi:hypothetical protein
MSSARLTAWDSRRSLSIRTNLEAGSYRGWRDFMPKIYELFVWRFRKVELLSTPVNAQALEIYRERFWLRHTSSRRAFPTPPQS